jgi:predicted dehydrogenase
MLIQGCHPIDLMRHFLGEIARVSAFKSAGEGNTKVYQVALEATTDEPVS